MESELNHKVKASFLIGYLIGHIEELHEIFASFDEKLNLAEQTSINQDIKAMCKWLEDKEEIDIELGNQAKNFLAEMRKADELGIDLITSLKQSEGI